MRPQAPRTPDRRRLQRYRASKRAKRAPTCGPKRPVSCGVVPQLYTITHLWKGILFHTWGRSTVEERFHAREGPKA